MKTAKDFLLEETILKNVAHSIEEPIAKTLSTNIQKEVSVKLKTILYHTVGDTLNYKGAQYVLATANLIGKIKGNFYFLTPTGEALNIAGTMMMLSPEELLGFINKGYTAESEDAFKEVISQIVGQLSTILRLTFKEVNGSVSTTKDLNILEDLKEFEANVEGDEFIFLVYEWQFKDEESFETYLVLSKELAFSIAPAPQQAEDTISISESKSLESEPKKELHHNIEAIRKIKVPLIVSLAQKKITVEEILKQMSVGSIIEFNVPFDSFLDLQIGEIKIGEGEVVTVNDVYGLQIKSVLSAKETLQALL